MSKIWGIVIITAIALIVSLLVYPFVLRFAIKRKIFDNPGARKLQKTPVPVFGGVGVYLGIIAAIGVSFFIMRSGVMVYGLIAMTAMLLIGVWDDIAGLSPYIRLLAEILVVLFIMFVVGASIDDFHGLWGIHRIGLKWSIPLSLIAGVGIINAINLIDGVNGYSSGFGIMACFFFGIAFFLTRNFSMGTLCFATGAALIPFFLHNVFGKSSRMFIGDGGTLMLGTLLTLCVFCTLSHNSPSAALESKGVGLVAFTLAVLGIPVFDTLRVMARRMIRGKSPFHPDKTHLHHIFIDCGFSHIGTSVTILSLQFLLVLIWYLSWKLGANIDWQLYIVIFYSLLVTFVFYALMRSSQRHKGRLYRFFVGFGRIMHINQRPGFKKIRKFIDHNALSIDYYIKMKDKDSRQN